MGHDKRMQDKTWHKRANKQLRTPEYQAVAGHLKHIRANKPSYVGMPFYTDWNPRYGGSLKAAERLSALLDSCLAISAGFQRLRIGATNW